MERYQQAMATGTSNNGLHEMDDPNYFEWWYFDLVTTNGTTIVIDYHASTLGNRDKIPRFFVSIYLPNGQTIKRGATLEPNAVMVSKAKCDIQYLDNRIIEDKNRIAINWRISDVTLDLTFEKQCPLLQLDDILLIEDPATKRCFNWLVAANRSKVRGSIITNNEKIDCSGVGYHDHNWGNLKLKDFISYWTWGRVLTDKHSIIFADIRERRNSIAGNLRPILFENEGELVFRGSQYHSNKKQMSLQGPPANIDLVTDISFGTTKGKITLCLDNFEQIDSIRFLYPDFENRFIRKWMISLYDLSRKNGLTFSLTDRLLRGTVYYRFMANCDLFQDQKHLSRGTALLEQMSFAS